LHPPYAHISGIFEPSARVRRLININPLKGDIQMMRISLKKTSLFAAVILTLNPAIAFADTGKGYITGIQPSMIKVKSNGQAYTQLDYIGNFSVLGKLRFSVGDTGRIKSWKASPVIENGYGIAAIIPGTGAYEKTKSYAIGHRPKTINQTMVFSLPGSMIENAAVAMCNLQANTLRGQGLSDHQIFNQHRYVSFYISMNASVDSTGLGSGDQGWEFAEKPKLEIQCSKRDGARIPAASNDLKAPLQVSKATMQLKEIVTLGGACMVETITAIVASEANATIKYRFLHSSGKKSKVFAVKTKGNKIAVVSHKWNIPNGPRIERGRLWIEGVAPGFKSNKARYSMRCKAKGAGGFAPSPKKPKVRIPLGGGGTLSN
jgi:uncharacterized membrane protein